MQAQKDPKSQARKIRAQYTAKEDTALDRLQALDAKVKRPAAAAAFAVGGLGAIVLGGGMSLVMTDIGSVIGVHDPLVPGIVLGVIGMALAAVSYPLYKRVLAARRKKFAQQIITLSDEII